MLSKLDNLNISHTRCEHQASLKPSPRHLPYLSLWKQSATLSTPVPVDPTAVGILVHSQVEVYIEVGFTSTSALDMPKSTGHKDVESLVCQKQHHISLAISMESYFSMSNLGNGAFRAQPAKQACFSHVINEGSSHLLGTKYLGASGCKNLAPARPRIYDASDQPRFSVCMALAKRWFCQAV